MQLFIIPRRRWGSLVLMFCFVGLLCGLTPVVATDKHSIIDRVPGCVEVDDLCLLPEEVANYEAIKHLHSQLDDDRSGDIDVSESVEFLKEELQYAKGYEKRQKVFHSNNDQYVSVAELWYMWKKSEVHNWTVEQTVSWLADSVELQQYAQNFYANAVNGSVLPRLAANNEQFLTKVLGIKDPKHRSKITIKAMDVVLFGPPKDSGNQFKDLVLMTLLTMAIFGGCKAYQRSRTYERQLGDMLKDMEKLKEAEENLQRLENRIQTNTGKEENHVASQEHIEEVQQLKLQLEQEREKNEQMKEQMRRGLEEAETEDRHWCAPVDLQHWLQLTYEREKIAFEKKQRGAREQYNRAREMCEKLNRQRRSLMGMIASVNGRMDNIDEAISQARTVMEEVTQELRERDQRWRNIEILAGCNITSNPGIPTLELMLRLPVNGRPYSTHAPSIGPSSCLSVSSLDDFDDDSLYHYNHSTVHQLLSTQSALMFLTMGGAGASSYIGGHSSPGLRESVADVRSSMSSLRKRSQLIARDSGSSLGSDSSSSHINMHHSNTYPTGLGHMSLEDEDIYRSSSINSISRVLRDGSQGKDSESSTEETDGSINVDNASLSIGGSCLTLNSETSGTASPIQEHGKISSSEPSLDSPRAPGIPPRNNQSPAEEGNSSDSSLLDERPENKKKLSKIFFKNGISGSLKFSKTKKVKDLDKELSKSIKSKS